MSLFRKFAIFTEVLIFVVLEEREKPIIKF